MRRRHDFPGRLLAPLPSPPSLPPWLTPAEVALRARRRECPAPKARATISHSRREAHANSLVKPAPTAALAGKNLRLRFGEEQRQRRARGSAARSAPIPRVVCWRNTGAASLGAPAFPALEAAGADPAAGDGPRGYCTLCQDARVDG